MFICVCEQVNEETLKQIIKQHNIKSVKCLHKLSIGLNCKLCSAELKRIVKSNSPSNK